MDIFSGLIGILKIFARVLSAARDALPPYLFLQTKSHQPKTIHKASCKQLKTVLKCHIIVIMRHKTSKAQRKTKQKLSIEQGKPAFSFLVLSDNSTRTRKTHNKTFCILFILYYTHCIMLRGQPSVFFALLFFIFSFTFLFIYFFVFHPVLFILCFLCLSLSFCCFVVSFLPFSVLIIQLSFYYLLSIIYCLLFLFFWCCLLCFSLPYLLFYLIQFIFYCNQY